MVSLESEKKVSKEQSELVKTLSSQLAFEKASL